jgi:ribosomal protein S5
MKAVVIRVVVVVGDDEYAGVGRKKSKSQTTANQRAVGIT